MSDHDLRCAIESTNLAAGATASDIERLVAVAVSERFHGVCVNPAWVPLAAALADASDLAIVTVLNFPLGADRLPVVLAQAELACADGAAELDLVLPLGAALGDDWVGVEATLSAVRSATSGRILKVIFETGLITEERLERAVQLALDAGVDFLKTSTGYGPRGASVEDVRRFAAWGAERAGVKASGGIRTREQALELLAAGATRLGTSRGVELLAAASQPI